MALIHCPECLQQISHEATACPKCGRPISRSEAAKAVKDSEAVNRGCLIGCGVIVLGLVLFIWYVASGGFEEEGAAERRAQEDLKRTLYYECQDAVRARLRSPSTAKFPGPFTENPQDVVRFMVDSSYRMLSYVDAQNAFGGTLRSNFICTFRQAADGRWLLEDLAM